MSIRAIATAVFLNNISIGNLDFPFSLLELILKMLLPLIVVFFVFKLIRRGITALVYKSRIRKNNKKKTVTWVRRIFNIIYYILVIILIGNLLGAETMKYVRMLFEILNQPFIESGGTRITIITLVLMIPVFYIGSWAGKSVKKIISRDFLDRIGLDDSRKFSFTSIIQYAIMIVVVLIGMSMIGIDLSALALIFGVLGIGLGFGLQHTIANLVAGFQIIFSRPVKEGDRILVNGIEGTVSQIRLNSTTITTLTNESIIIPNSNIVQNLVHNYSYEDRRIIISNNVQISYSDDPEKALEILRSIGEDNPFRVYGTDPIVRFKSFGESGLDLLLFTWINEVEDKYEALTWANIQIWKRFRENNITIPFPHIQLIQEKDRTEK